MLPRILTSQWTSNNLVKMRFWFWHNKLYLYIAAFYMQNQTLYFTTEVKTNFETCCSKCKLDWSIDLLRYLLGGTLLNMITHSFSSVLNKKILGDRNGNIWLSLQWNTMSWLLHYLAGRLTLKLAMWSSWPVNQHFLVYWWTMLFVFGTF